MNKPILSLCLFGFALMAALPIVFFRRGRLNARWLLTAAPFFVAAASVVAALMGVLRGVRLLPAGVAVVEHAAVLLTALAIALLACTLGVHRESLSLWHQEDDTPAFLVTRGPYSRIRHPFYTSFLLLLTGTVCALPHPLTLAVLLVGWLQLAQTARREERRLLASPFGAEYARLMRRTGRFLPSFRHPTPCTRT